MYSANKARKNIQADGSASRFLICAQNASQNSAKDTAHHVWPLLDTSEDDCGTQSKCCLLSSQILNIFVSIM